MFKNAQAEVDEWISQFEAGYWKPHSNLARLVEEVGELAREINHQFGEKPKKSSEREGAIADELGDVLFVTIAMANSLGIDLDEAFANVLAKYRRRDAGRWRRKEE